MDSPKKLQKYKSSKKYKSSDNSTIFWATDSRFCMEVHMDCWTLLNQMTKYKSARTTKSTKVQNRKVQKCKKGKKFKYAKNVKNVKSTKYKVQKYKNKKKDLGAS